jgi:hypothetical protein
LSDLHFGAENSLLTHIDLTETAVTVDPREPSKTLRAFVACLHAVVAANEPTAPKPTLILAGDIIEFALASDNVAAMAFERFVELAFPAGAPVFDATIVYVPGNHDHHMWETARENQYANYVRRHPSTEPLGVPWHSTEMFKPDKEERVVESELLTAVLERMGRTDLRIVVHYPNFALAGGADGERVVVFHHGHFVESMYRLMSLLRGVIFPGQKKRDAAPWDWESENFAWIDFFWSTLGRSGEWGTDVGLIYDMLRDNTARELMAQNLAGFAIRKVKPAFLRRPLQWIVSKFTRRLLKRVKRLEREQTGGGKQLTDDARKGLREYIEGPLAVQLKGDRDGKLPTDFAFVFGHTHKPFEEVAAWGYTGGRAEIYNTGGWVVDTLEPEARQGAAAILLDENLAVASLRLYNQHLSEPEYRVEVRAAREGEFVTRLRGVVDPAAGPWAELSTVVAKAVPQRCQALGFIIEAGIRELKGQAP